jgi:hypothetical protein
MRATERAGALGLVEPANLVELARVGALQLDRAGEQELARVDALQLDRHRHAFVAAGRVCGVEQPAAPGHEPNEAVAGALQPFPERCRRDVEHLGAGAVVKSHDLSEDVRNPVRRVQAQEHRQRARSRAPR